MNELFKDLDVNGIVEPGENYFLTPSDDREDDLPDCWRYLINRDADILRALEREMLVMLKRDYELRKVLRLVKMSEVSYEFRMLCYFKDEQREGEMSMYLHRVRTFEEELAN